MIGTMVQVFLRRLNGQTELLIEHPWRDVPVPHPNRHPVLAELDKVGVWQADLQSGRVGSFSALAKRERITAARVSQLMRLTRLSASAVALLRRKLAVWRGPKEAFSMRRLQALVLLPEIDQLCAIEELGEQIRRHRRVN
jgi:hypothetical protein